MHTIAHRSRRNRLTALLLAAAAAAVLLIAPVGAQADSSGMATIGLTDDGRIVAFSTDRPGSVRQIGVVQGLQGDTTLVGIDFRVQDGRLYGVGDAGGIYTVDTGTAAATKVSQLTVTMSGQRFGVDFNPAADRLRVISDSGQNLRHNLNDGLTTTDGTLNYPAVPGVTAVGVTGAAYTNNDLDATTATTLFDIDTNVDQVAIQSPANAGLLAPTGSLGVAAGPWAGADIYTDVRRGEAVSNAGFAALDVDGKMRLFGINLLTGQTQAVGGFPTRHQVVDIAIVLDS